MVGCHCPVHCFLNLALTHTVVNWHVNDVLHHPFRILCIFVSLLWLHVGELRGASIGVDTCLIEELNEQKFVRDDNGKKPEESVLLVVAGAIDACFNEVILGIEVLRQSR